MSRPGLSASPFTPAFAAPSGAGLRAPKPPESALAPAGLEGMPSFDVDASVTRLRALAAELGAAPQEQEDTSPFIAFSPSSKQLYVNGFTFAENDATRALESAQYLGQSAARPESGDWERIPASVYQDYLQSIRDPDAGTRFGKSFSSGVGSLQQLWGAALMAATDGGAGQGLYEAGGARMERLQPFAKKFSEIKDLDDAGDYMVSLLGSQAPNILESITAGLIGAGLGAAVGTTTGPVGTAAGGAGGLATGLFAKGALKAQLKAIANKKLAKQAVTPDEDALWKRESGKTGIAIQLAARKKAAGEVLSPDEQKLIRQGAAVTGALTLSTLENYGIGVGDTFSEMIERGVSDEPGARAAAFGYAVPYAALSTAPEFLGALALFRPTTRTGLRAAAGRLGTGTAVGAVGEGVSEATQEGLIMGAAEGFGAQYTPQERGERLFEAGVAGALLGGTIGGPINLLRKPEREAGITPPAAPTVEPAPVEPLGIGYEQQLMLGYEPIEARRAAEDEVITPPFYSRQPAPVTRPVPSPGYNVNATVEPLAPLFEGAPQRERDLFAITALEPSARPVPAPGYNINESVQPLYGVTPEALEVPAPPAPAAQPTVAAVGPVDTGVDATDIDVADANAVYTPKAELNKAQKRGFAWLSSNLSSELATRLSTSNNVLLEPNSLNIGGLQAVAPSVITVSFKPSGRRTNPIKVAYAESTYGSPQEFAATMGFDPAALTTYTRRSKSPTGETTATVEQAVSTYKALPAPPITPAQAKERKDIRATARARRKPAASTTKEEAPRAFQKRTPKEVDVREQAGTGRGIRKKDAARDKPAGQSKAETTEKVPVRADEEAVTVTNFPKTKKDQDGRFTVTLSDGSTAKVYFDRSGTLGTGWYSDERSKFAPSQPEYVSDYLGTSREEAVENLPGVLARLRAEKEKPATKAKPKASVSRNKMPIDERNRTLTTATNEALIDEATMMETPALKSPQGKYTIELMKELQRRVTVEKGTYEELTTIGTILNEFSDPKSTTMKTLLNEARRQLNPEAAPKPSIDTGIPGMTTKEVVAQLKASDVETKENAYAELVERSRNNDKEAESAKDAFEAAPENKDVIQSGNRINTEIRNRTSVIGGMQDARFKSAPENWKNETDYQKRIIKLAAQRLLTKLNRTEDQVKVDTLEEYLATPTSRASVAPSSLKKNKVNEQTVRGVVDRILSKLSPKVRNGTEVQYAASMEDLKANNPKLYRLLEASRGTQGDIDTVVPAGLYLRRGDGTASIVMFTDNIVDETHATLVFLEEMVSHHGFSAVLGNDVNPLMEKIYDENPEIAAAAEAYVKENKGVSKAEAVEEVIAKELAREIGIELGLLSPSADPSYVPVGILTRLINEIKKLLNKVFGKQTVAFMDSEDVRQLFAKSKQFARTGQVPDRKALKAHFNFTGTYRSFAQEPRTAAPVVYHGSPNKVEGDLRPSSSAGLFGPGVYLTSDKERARGYAGITGEVVELTVSGKLATRDQWKAATRAVSQGMKPSPNAQTEIDNKAIADLEAQGFVGVQAGNIVTVWKAGNLQSAVRSRFSAATPEDGPKAADRLTPEERSVIGNTLAADVYERATNGTSADKIAADLELNVEIVKGVLALARQKLKAAGVTPRARRTSPKKTTKAEQAILALGTRKADGSFPSVEEVAKAIDAEESTVKAAVKEARADYINRGEKLPDFLVPPEIRGTSRAFEYAQAVSPLYNPQRPIPRDLANALDWLNDTKSNVAQLGRDILNALKTMNFSSRSNAGYREGYRILTDMKNEVARLRSKYNAMLEETLASTDDKIRKDVSAMLQFTTQAKMTDLTDRELKKYGPLFTIEGNKVVVRPEVFKKLSLRGRFTLADFQKDMVREQETALLDENDNPVSGTRTISFKGMPDLTEDSPAWKLYQQVRDAMDEAAIDRVRADYAAAFGARENTFRTIEYATSKTLAQADKDFVLRIDQRYRELAKQGATPDETGRLVHKVNSLAEASEMIADFNRVLIAKDKDEVYTARLEKFAKNFPATEQAEVKKQIESFRNGMTFAESNQYDVQRVVADLAALELGKEDSELYAMRSIAGGYIPIGRTGRWQTRVRAVDPATGKAYGLMESFRVQLPYFQFQDRAAAERMSKDINELFPADKATMKLPVFDTETKKYVVKEVRLEAVADAARETPSVDPGININEFTRMITRFGIALTPEERERIIIGMTEQNAKARTNLQRQNTTGADPDSIPYISQHLETLSNITGRRTHQHRTDILLDEKDPASQRLWNGDVTRLKALEERLKELRDDPNATAGQVRQAERDYDQYAFEMRRTKEEGGAAVFKDRFVRDLAYLEEQKALEYTDFASEGVGQSLRTWTAVAQLGGSFATAALNVLSLPLNVLPALASYNSENGFGGDFGFTKAAAALTAAGKDVGGTGKYSEGYYKELLKNKEALANSGLTRDEAEFLAREIEFGNLQASTFNALTASAKGKLGRKPVVQKFMTAYMSAFTYSEQASRRAAALAGYRLEKERLLDAGIDPENAQKLAGRFAIDLMDGALGNYAMYNRPGSFRGGLRDFIFMYKMYPITVIQLLSAMSPSGRAAMLVPLLVMSGIKGLPGAEDIMDIIDSIMQALGMKVGSSEKWLADQLNALVPGLSPTVMRGVVDQLIPATISSRTGLGNLIPGTSMFVSGANQFNEFKEILGPSFSFVEQSLTTATRAAQTGLATVGLSDRDVGVTGILRGSPVTMARAVGDTLEYYQTGAIVDSKGYVASYDLNAGTVAARLLGFYPSAATRQNDVVRVTKREADYLRTLSAEFRQSYVKAALRNDREGMQRVVQRVRDWNEASKGSGLEIPNFPINARRAVEEARKTSSERYAASAPKSLRRDIEEAQEASGIE